ncbi:MAG: 2-hydroxyacyl-CoA dehydratase [Dehalococcoidia bacterium]|jgi:benzoyl-CoA reductase subunit C|nr:2-hydroxyacyl-CoA dehydratase [Dehalococcoidia bacterium]
MQALAKLQKVVAQRHDHAQGWKQRTGGRVVGYLCTYVPEEVLYAAGVLPVRVMGSHEVQDVTEAHISSMWCPFCRDCLAQGLQGRYEYLDGLVLANACHHIHHTYESWVRHVPTDYHYEMYFPPNVQMPLAKGCLTGEIQEFQASIERWLGRAIQPQDMERAIGVYNTNRLLLRRLYELRKQDPPPITGAEVMEVVLASMFMDKAEHNQILEKLLSELPARQGAIASGTRLMVIGAETDDVDFLRFTESLGTNIVVDEHCVGSRYFWNEVVPDVDWDSALATRLIERPPCPHKDLMELRRVDHIVDLAQQWGVKGAVLVLQKFCDTHQFDTPYIQKALGEKGIPLLSLELDITVPTGQFRTRLEAFLEMIEAGV